jgi:hypothetical protein
MTCTVSEYLFAATAAAFLVLSLVSGLQSISLVTMLRLRHPVTWNLLGRPDGTSNSDDTGNALALIDFLRRREYRQFEDPQLSLLCERSRRGMLLSVLTLAITLVFLAVTPSLERALLLQCWRLA